MRFVRQLAALVGAAVLFALPAPAMAHCDGLDGPVVTAARAALDSGDANGILIWVQPADEAEVRAVFADAVAVRKLGPEARELADRHFFETLVRLHRAGEGAPYMGLKPAGRDLGPAIPLADKAIADGSERELADFLAKQASTGVHERFAELQRKRKFRANDLAAGRAYVASYVTFIHYVEGLHEAAEAKAEGHFVEAEAGGGSAHD
jgi:hypothetical protein